MRKVYIAIACVVVFLCKKVVYFSRHQELLVCTGAFGFRWNQSLVIVFGIGVISFVAIVLSSYLLFCLC